MKAIKYLLAGALMTGFSAPSMAQDIKSQLDAITKVIVANKANPDAAKKQVQEFYKANKKNAEALVGLGRAYLDIKDTINASKYADEAIKKDKKNGAGYILKGDIEAFKDNGGGAAKWYQQAVYFDPQNPQGYIKYAYVYRVSSPGEAVDMLNKLRTVDPTYPVDAVAGHFYYEANDFDKAIENFGKADINKLDGSQLTEYAMSAYFKQNFDKAIEVATTGSQKFPRMSGLNRIAFYSYTDKKDYDNALSFADKLFNQSDSAKFTALDYTYQGYAYNGKKDYDNSITSFNKALEMNPNRTDVMQVLSQAYAAKGDYANAATIYKNFLAAKKDATANDYAGLATIYRNQASETNQTQEQRDEAVKNADAAYADLAKRFPDAEEFAVFMRARLSAALDPDSKKGLAKPHYERLAELVEKHTGELSNVDKARILEAYHYMAYYNYSHDNVAGAKTIAEKIIKIDPSDNVANQILGAK